jgi:hypothetical protein
MNKQGQIYQLDYHHEFTGLLGASHEPSQAAARGPAGLKQIFLPSEMVNTWYPGALRRLETRDAIFYENAENALFDPLPPQAPRIRNMDRGNIRIQVAELVDTPETILEAAVRSCSETHREQGEIDPAAIKIIFTDVIDGDASAGTVRYIPQSDTIVVAVDAVRRISNDLHGIQGAVQYLVRSTTLDSMGLNL